MVRQAIERSDRKGCVLDCGSYVFCIGSIGSWVRSCVSAVLSTVEFVVLFASKTKQQSLDAHLVLPLSQLSREKLKVRISNMPFAVIPRYSLLRIDFPGCSCSQPQLHAMQEVN